MDGFLKLSASGPAPDFFAASAGGKAGVSSATRQLVVNFRIVKWPSE